MADMRDRQGETVEEAKTSPNPQVMNDQTPNMSAYERSREERIKANLDRMQKLGLVDLSLKLKSLTSPPKRTPRTTPSSAKASSPLQPAKPPRRSSRLNNATPVSYSEAALAKKVGLLESEYLILEEGSKLEVYTEEHEKLLGSTEKSWTLFVDGYGKDGKRIYDQVKGKTCHQCRQKTLGHRTHCNKCKIVQGQFCGDCLYMRYGEHVLEAIENRNWICPVCRGICNCSLCRQSKGWAPTGPLYRKISRMGYQSVAHYLIQTRRSQNTVEKNMATINQLSAKRSLPFSEMEILSNRSPQINYEQAASLMPRNEDKTYVELKNVEENQLPNSGTFASDSPIDNLGCEGKPVNVEVFYDFGLSKPISEDNLGCEGRPLNVEVFYDFELPKPISEDKNELELKVEPEKKLDSSDKEDDKSKIVLESRPKLQRERAPGFQPRQRRQQINDQGNAKGSDKNERNSNVNQTANDAFLNQEAEKGEEMHVEDNKHADSIIVLENSPKPKKKSASAAEPNPDSIGGRLRQRRRMSEGYDDKLPA